MISDSTSTTQSPLKPYISVVVPIYNESASLVELFTRLHATLDQLGRPYQLIAVNDGSQDDSWQLLRQLQQQRPDQVVIVDFVRNFGQHMAVIAGFMQVQGEIVVTLDADLQNPPEEIPKLVQLVEQGYDLVSGVRLYHRKDHWLRKWASILINYLRERITDIKMVDHGCMLRAYSLQLVKLMIASHESSIFIPALAYSYARRPTEIEVAHRERSHGKSRYSLYNLIRLNFDLMAGYSLVPIQIFSVIGCIISFFSILLVGYLLLRRLLIGPEVEGVFTLFALLFFLVGIVLLGIGIVGEYIGRIYKEVRGRQRFAVREIIGQQLTSLEQMH